MRSIATRFLVVLFAVFVLAGCRSADDLGNEPENLVSRSRVTFQSMMSDPQYPALLSLASRARGVLIVPDLFRGGFLVGGRGGNGVMLVRGDDGRWSSPAFYTIGGVSLGLQFGVQASEVVLVIMTQKGVDAIMEREVTLGGDAGLAVGEIGQGVNAAVGIGLKADMYAFARSQGLFAGISLDGSMIHPRESFNAQLYGQGTSPKSILVDRRATTSSQAVRGLVSAMP